MPGALASSSCVCLAGVDRLRMGVMRWGGSSLGTHGAQLLPVQAGLPVQQLQQGMYCLRPHIYWHAWLMIDSICMYLGANITCISCHTQRT